VPGRQGREGLRLRPSRAQVPSARLRRAVSDDGKVIALDVGEAETEAFWRSFLRSLGERGLAEEGDRASARLPLAALQRPLPGRGARPRLPRAAAYAGRAPVPALHGRLRARRHASVSWLIGRCASRDVLRGGQMTWHPGDPQAGEEIDHALSEAMKGASARRPLSEVPGLRPDNPAQGGGGTR
jgi:hypothetical protein